MAAGGARRLRRKSCEASIHLRVCPDLGHAKKFTLPAEKPVLPLPSLYLPEMHVGP